VRHIKEEFSMRYLILAGATLALAACSGGNSTANTAGNELDANMSLEAPANDESAMESAGNATETAPAPADNAAGNAAGDTGPGDSGGNNVESNVAGM
jgi:hypothetical protein